MLEVQSVCGHIAIISLIASTLQFVMQEGYQALCHFLLALLAWVKGQIYVSAAERLGTRLMLKLSGTTEFVNMINT